MMARRLLIAFMVIWSLLVVRYWWSSQYDSDDFNCVDMSHAVAPVFHGLGVPTEIVYGQREGARVGHCWVRVWGWDFEATSLWFRDMSDYKVRFVDRAPFGYWDDLRAGRVGVVTVGGET